MQFTFSLSHIFSRIEWNKCRHRFIHCKSYWAVVHDAAVVVRGREHGDMSDKLLEIENSFLLDVVPIHFDVIVTITGERMRRRVNVK